MCCEYSENVNTDLDLLAVSAHEGREVLDDIRNLVEASVFA